jgi:hypothetical protein
MENEIIMNEEVIEATEEIATAKSHNGLKIAGGIALLSLISFAAYKGGKWVRAKIEAKKAQKQLESATSQASDDESEE